MGQLGTAEWESVLEECMTCTEKVGLAEAAEGVVAVSGKKEGVEVLEGRG
jgi:hypothetical protein